MAANNENYIGVAMGLDVTDLKEGLLDANKQIQLANSEFKAAASGMEDWQKSTEGLAAKIKQLDTVLDLQKKKLSGLQAEYDHVVKSQGENSEAARKLKVQINNQKAVVNATEKELKGYSETLSEAEKGNIDLTEVTLKNGKALKKQGEAAKESGGKLEGLKGVAGGVAAGLAAIGAAAVAAVGSFLSLAESTRETRTMMAKLEAQFTTAGHSAQTAADTYSKLYGVVGDTGKASEAAAFLAQMANSEAELADYTNILTGVYAKYGDALPVEGLAEAMNHTAQLGEVQGNLADALEWSGVNVDDFNAQLAECNDVQARQELIVSTLNGLYSEQADAYRKANKDVIEAQEAQEKLNLALAELGAIAEPIMTTLKILATDLLKEITPFVELIGTGLRGAIEGTAGATDKLAEGLGGILKALVDKLMNMLPTVLNVILQLVPTIANTLLEALPQLLDVVLDLVTQIINLLSELAPQIIAKVVEIIPILIEKLVEAVPQLLQAAITLLMAIVDALPTIIASLVAALPQLIDTIISVILEAFPMLVEAAIQLFMALLDALPVVIQALVENLPRIIDTIITGLLDALPLVLQAAITMLMAIIDALPTIIRLLIQELPKINKTICNALIDAIPDIIKAAVDLFFAILEAIPKIRIELLKNMPEIISAIVEGLGEGFGAIVEVGANLLSGVWEGITSGMSEFKENVTKFGSKVVGWFKDAFDVHSPSRLMADEVGKYIGEGIGVGVLDSIPSVKKQLGKFSSFVTDNLGGIKSGLSIDGANGGTAKAGTTVVNAGLNITYNGNLSRKQIKRLEQDNYMAIKTRLKAEGAI